MSLEQQRPTQRNKSVQEVSKPKSASGFGKTDVRYWFPRIFHATYTKNGVGHKAPDWSMKIRHEGRRETFPLGTPNKAAAAEKAKQIYLALQAKGWEAVRAQFKPHTQSSNSSITTVGEFLGAVEIVWSGNSKTLSDYSRALRTIVSDIFKIDGGRTKYDYRTGGRRAWIARIDAIRLRDITPHNVQQWKVSFLKRAGKNPTKRKSASISANSLLRQAKSLFSPKILKFVQIDLPTSSPFEGVQFEPRRSSRYQSGFDVNALVPAAEDELQQELFKIFLLALMAGLRRNEIDKLEWNSFNWEKDLISIRATEYFHPKSEDSTGDVEVDEEVMDLFRGFKAAAKGNFVIESSVAARPGSSYSHYRCQKRFEKLGQWLREHGVSGSRPLHTLRKEYGSQVCAKYGIFTASRALRHADIAITSQHYVDRLQSARPGLGALLQSATNIVPMSNAARPRKQGSS